VDAVASDDLEAVEAPVLLVYVDPLRMRDEMVETGHADIEEVVLGVVGEAVKVSRRVSGWTPSSCESTRISA